MANIYDIAKAANTSSATVSFVLNGRGREKRISEHTINKIKNLAIEMNYIPNVSAKRLNADKNSSTLPEIALLWSTSQHFTYLNSFIHTAQKMLDNNEVQKMKFTIIPFREGALNEYDNFFSSNHCNGLIVPHVTLDDYNFIENLETSIPLILLFGKSKKHSVVTVDNLKAGKLAADMFINKGIKNAVYIGEQSFKYNLNPSDRRDGFMNKCIENGIDVDNIIIPLDIITNDGNPELQIGAKVGEWCVKQLCSQKSLPQAIFAQNDLIASSLLKAFRKRNISIPDDIMLLAYGSSFFAENSSPTITTIHHDYHKIAHTTILLMEELLLNPSLSPSVKIVKTPVIYRESFPKL